MRLSHLTLTGADDTVDPAELARLSAEVPLIEWGILFTADQAAGPRFPSASWRKAFCRAAPQARRAAHLCGTALLQALSGSAVGGDVPLEIELRGAGAVPPLAPYQRLQLNFDARHLPPAVLTSWMADWRAGRWRSRSGLQPGLITQHNPANARVHALFADQDGRHADGYGVLFDASGGRGLLPGDWPVPMSGVHCGYAGGLAPDTVEAALSAIGAVVGDRTVWIDMEAGLREHDRFDLDRVHRVIAAVRRQAGGAPLVPGVLLSTGRRA